ncbi:MAG: hypothetical protein ACYCPS_01105 [Candidatus Saccharimonadales bacterium]
MANVLETRLFKSDVPLSELQKSWLASLALIGSHRDLVSLTVKPEETGLHEVLVEAAKAPKVTFELLWLSGQAIVRCYPGQIDPSARDETGCYAISELTNHPSDLIRHQIFYGLEKDNAGEEYLCMGGYFEGGPEHEWLNGTYRTSYKIRKSDFAIIRQDRVLPDQDSEPTIEGIVSQRRHPLYDAAEEIFSNLVFSYQELYERTNNVQLK